MAIFSNTAPVSLEDSSVMTMDFNEFSCTEDQVNYFCRERSKRDSATVKSTRWVVSSIGVNPIKNEVRSEIWATVRRTKSESR